MLSINADFGSTYTFYMPLRKGNYDMMITSVHPSSLPSRPFLAVQAACVIQRAGFGHRVWLCWLGQ